MEKAIEVLKRGGIVIFPTDTAYGMGSRIDNEKAVRRLFKIRKRPKNKPLLALVDSIEMAQKYLAPIPKKVMDELIKPFWPGPLTIILKSKKDKVLNLVRGGGNTLGVRFPNHETVLKLIKEIGVPILAPSANFSGAKTPFRFADLDQKLVRLVDYVLRGVTGGSKNVSTIIDCSKEPWEILRKGAIDLNQEL